MSWAPPGKEPTVIKKCVLCRKSTSDCYLCLTTKLLAYFSPRQDCTSPHCPSCAAGVRAKYRRTA